MAQTGYTPILIYGSSTSGNAPAAGNLTNSTLGSELAINITDGKLFYKDNSNAIQVIGWKTTPTTAGGTGLTSYAAGDLLYASATNTLATLAKNTLATRYLSNTGAGNNPAWAQIDLTNGVTGTLPTTNGGTGLTSFTANSLVYTTSTSALTTNTNLQTDGTSLKLQSVALLRGYSYSAGNQQTWLGNNLNEAWNYQSTDTAQLFRMLTGVGFEWMDAPSGTGGTAASLTSRMTLALSTGNLTLATGNLVQGTAAKGVNFTANSAAAGMTSQLLNWYEEGTWTPVATNLTVVGTVTYTARYTRIGRRVFCTLKVNSTGSTSAINGSTYFTGLPYSVAVRDVCMAANEGSTAGLGNSLVDTTGPTLFVPSWTTLPGVCIAFSYET